MATPQETGIGYREEQLSDGELADRAGRFIERYIGTLREIPELTGELVTKFFSRNRLQRGKLPNGFLEFQRGDRHYAVRYSINLVEEDLEVNRVRGGQFAESVWMLIQRQGGLPYWGTVDYRDSSDYERVYPANGSAAVEKAETFLEELKRTS